MRTRAQSVVVVAALVFGASGAVQAQGFGRAVEDFENLGALGAGVAAQGAEVLVKKVFADGPAAKAGLVAGDVIVKAGGRALQASAGQIPGPVLQVVAEIERAEAARKKPAVVLVVRRGGSEKEIKVPVQKLGKHAKSCPKKCKKCTQILKAGVAFLVRTQGSNGEFSTDLGGKTGKVVVTALGGLALLSAGISPAKNSPLDRAANYVLTRAGKADTSPLAGAMGGGGRGNWNQVNWELSYALMFMAEMGRKTKRPEFKAKCAELVKILNVNQEGSGGWAHGPGGPNALGYLELEIVSNYALLGMGAAQKLGLELDEEKVGKAMAWIEKTTSGNGGIGYSDRSGQKGHGDPGRTAGALLAAKALGQTGKFYGKMAGFFQGNMAKLKDGHVSPAMHLLAGAMAAKMLGGKVWKQYMSLFRLHIMGVRKPDGSFAGTPTQESRSMRNNTDLTVGPRWLTATYVLILSLDNGNLPYLLGGKGGKKSGKKRIKARVKTGGSTKYGR
jgi:hypothetical protein